MAGCTSLGCPRLRNLDPSDRAMSITVSSTQITRDKSGHEWCNYCQKQRELMDYGKEHHWPNARVQVENGWYAILGDATEWFTSIAMGNQGMIDAFYAELIGKTQVLKGN